ncbi:putative fibrillin-1 [Apostichopus japonicus]|uniref:Putative fibrillin-1 n=1 Tax=Stichopus japonicus TaxID=307972 RepID=A0A2G8LP68_STIJA|nr:putative fibrillin-1 [Apostichopus japonicus]
MQTVIKRDTLLSLAGPEMSIAVSFVHCAVGIDRSDIDECTSGNDCDTLRGTCTNVMGSYTCTCNVGYQGDGRNCTDLNECNVSNDCDSICNNIEGTFFCSCEQGYSLNPNLPSQCLDIDECALSIDNCTQGCNNTDGSYSCYCYDGFILEGDVDCIGKHTDSDVFFKVISAQTRIEEENYVSSRRGRMLVQIKTGSINISELDAIALILHFLLPRKSIAFSRANDFYS